MDNSSHMSRMLCHLHDALCMWLESSIYEPCQKWTIHVTYIYVIIFVKRRVVLHTCTRFVTHRSAIEKSVSEWAQIWSCVHSKVMSCFHYFCKRDICQIWSCVHSKVMSCSCNSFVYREQHTATRCYTLQHTATHSKTLQHSHLATQCIPRTTQCSTLQHTTTNCITLQHSHYCIARTKRRRPWRVRCGDRAFWREHIMERTNYGENISCRKHITLWRECIVERTHCGENTLWREDMMERTHCGNNTSWRGYILERMHSEEMVRTLSSI